MMIDAAKKLSLGLYGHRFRIDDVWLTYQSAYGRSFRVAKTDIESVSVEPAGWGKCVVRIVGRGTSLADVKLPQPWAYRVQEFVMSELRS